MVAAVLVEVERKRAAVGGNGELLLRVVAGALHFAEHMAQGIVHKYE